MSGILDTSILVRYLVRDSPDLTDRATQLVDGEDELQITDVVLAETAYVLASVYQISREAIVDHLMAVVEKRNISIYGLDKGVVLQALLLCRPSGRVSFGDAMIWAAARSSGNSIIYSFDERFPSDGVEIHRG